MHKICLCSLDWELESYFLVGQGEIYEFECVKFRLYIGLVLGVEVDLQGLGAIYLVSDALANNLSGVDNIL